MVGKSPSLASSLPRWCLNVASDGKSLATAIRRYRDELWMLGGFNAPRTWWQRLRAFLLLSARTRKANGPPTAVSAPDLPGRFVRHVGRPIYQAGRMPSCPTHSGKPTGLPNSPDCGNAIKLV